MPENLADLHAYNRWADDRMIAVCRSLTPEQYAQPLPGAMDPLRSTLVHIAGANTIWLARLGGGSPTERPPVERWSTLEDAARVLAETHDAFDQFLDGSTPERLAMTLSYRNFQGEPYEAPVRAILTHVVNHATYHRGQVAVKLKRLGIQPPSTDYIAWAIEPKTGA